MRNPARRQFMKQLAALIAAGCLPPSLLAQSSPPRPPLSLPLSALRDHYEVVVIGSGYGGSVMAARLARGRRLCVLERGREWAPADFPDGLAQILGQVRSGIKPLGLFDVHVGTSLGVLTGSGLGGTSLINANVVIAPDRDIFGNWPEAIRRDYLSGAMNHYERRVRDMLAAVPVTEADRLRKNWFHRSTSLARLRAGANVTPHASPLAVNLHRYQNEPNAQGVWQAPCSFCGDCVTGCRVGAKNTLDVNYLPLARNEGAELFAGVEVDWIERRPDGSWRLHLIEHPPGQLQRRRTLQADQVIVAAGALGSSQLLLRSGAQGLPLSPALGTRFSTNGDLLGFGYDSAVQTNIMGFGIDTPPTDEQRVGPTITTVADYRGIPTIMDRFIIEEGAVPSGLVDAARLALPLVAGRMPDFPMRQRVERDLAHRRTDGALNHGMVYLGIGHDSAGGRVELDRFGNATVNWPGLMQEPFVARQRAEMAQQAAVFGGTYIDGTLANGQFNGELITVHPLGGCPMADSVDNGVVNADGQVYDPAGHSGAVHRGLHVVDGAILPGSIGVNPLLTIAALAERAAAHYRV